jgi:peptidyl-prolyl cis-trans isomerase C
MRRALSIVSLAAAVMWLEPALAQTSPDPDPVVAIVNGESIKRSEIENAKSSLPDQYRQLPLEMIYEPLLNRVIDQRLLTKEAEKRDLAESPAVKQELERARATVLQGQLIQQAIDAGTTPERLQQAYTALQQQPGFAQEEVHASHILVEDEGKAKALISQLEAGAAFNELASANSTDPSAQSNAGDLGWFTRDMMVPEFADAAFKIEPGMIGKEPVQSQFGWHVIKVEERRTKVPTFEEKEPELREQVAREIVASLVTDVREGAQIQRFNLDGSPQAQ